MLQNCYLRFSIKTIVNFKKLNENDFFYIFVRKRSTTGRQLAIIPMKESFLHKINQFIKSRQLLPVGECRVGVGLSGGADSVALLSALVESGYRCVAVHCNFSLRGEESDGDEMFCRRLCERLGVELIVERFDTIGSRLGGESVEMACRRLRYDLFERLLASGAVNKIALGHHREDSVETFMINLFRGTGPKGLEGIRAERGPFIRPLLGVSRSEIEDYCREKGLEWRIDTTNLKNDYRRNALRNVILPGIGRFFPDFEKGIELTAANMTYASALVDRHIDALYNQCVKDGQAIHVARLAEMEEEMTPRSLFLLARRVVPGGITLTQAENIVDNIGKSGLIFQNDTVTMCLSHGWLRPVNPLDDHSYKITFGDDLTHPVGLTFRLTDPTEMNGNFKVNVNQLLVDGSIVEETADFVLRHPRRGDRLKPFGMKGSRLLSDIFSDLKFSEERKRSQWVLCRNDEIIWLPGLRASRLFRVTNSSKTAYLVTFHPNTAD